MLWGPMVFMMAVTFTALGMTIVKLSKAFMTTGLDLGNSLQLIFAVLLLILGVLVAIQVSRNYLKNQKKKVKQQQLKNRIEIEKLFKKGILVTRFLFLF